MGTTTVPSVLTEPSTVDSASTDKHGSRSRVSRWLERHCPAPAVCAAASLVVGTLVTLVNYGDAMIQGRPDLAWAWVIPLTFLASAVLIFASAGSIVTPAEPALKPGGVRTPTKNMPPR